MKFCVNMCVDNRSKPREYHGYRSNFKVTGTDLSLRDRAKKFGSTITHEPLHLTWWHFARTCTSTTSRTLLNSKVNGQRSRPRSFFVVFFSCVWRCGYPRTVLSLDQGLTIVFQLCLRGALRVFRADGDLVHRGAARPAEPGVDPVDHGLQGYRVPGHQVLGQQGLLLPRQSRQRVRHRRTVHAGHDQKERR